MKSMTEAHYKELSSNLKNLLTTLKEKTKDSDLRKFLSSALDKIETIEKSQDMDKFKTLKLLQYLNSILNLKQNSFLKSELLQFFGNFFNVIPFEPEQFKKILGNFRLGLNPFLTGDLLLFILGMLNVYDVVRFRRTCFFAYHHAPKNEDLLKRYLKEKNISYPQGEKDLEILAKREVLIEQAYGSENLLKRAEKIIEAAELGQINAIILCLALAKSNLNELTSYRLFFTAEEFSKITHPDYDCLDKEKLYMRLIQVKNKLKLDSNWKEFFAPSIVKDKFVKLLSKHNPPMYHFIRLQYARHLDSFYIEPILIDFLITKDLTEKSEKYRCQFLNYWQFVNFDELSKVSPLLSINPNDFENLDEYWEHVKSQLFSEDIFNGSPYAPESYAHCVNKATKVVNQYLQKKSEKTISSEVRYEEKEIKSCLIQ